MNGLPIVASATDRVRRKLEDIRQRRLDPSPVPADVYECAESYLIVADAAGVTHDNVEVRYVDDRVFVRIERFRDTYEGFKLQTTGRDLSFDDEIPLPPDAVVDPETAEATIRANGTLLVSVPKSAAEESPPEVSAGTPEASD